MILDLFAGMGGWSAGLRALGLSDLGVECDEAACETRYTAGFATWATDIRAVTQAQIWELRPFVDGLIASPPCPQFSSAGKGHGRRVMDQLGRAIRSAYAGEQHYARHQRSIARTLRASNLRGKATKAEASEAAWHAAREAMLMAQPARWLSRLNPEWVAMEQVPAGLPLLRLYGSLLLRDGWASAWAGILNAADYGVPQTRQRAILIANRSTGVSPPAPTHARGGESTLFGELLPWVSMAEALGWVPNRQLDRRQNGAPVLDCDSVPAPTLTAAAVGKSIWKITDGEGVVRTGANTMKTGRTGTRAGDGDVSAYERPLSEPAPTLDRKVGGAWTVWPRTMPATTVCADPRITARNHHNAGSQGTDARSTEQVRAGDYSGTEPIKLTVAEALVLQSFSPETVVHGPKSKQFEQVGNAVPPLLAMQVARAAMGREA